MLILINGPKQVGKTTFVTIAKKEVRNCAYYKIGKPLQDAVNAFFGIAGDNNTLKALEQYKDDPAPQLLGLSYREAQISLFKNWAEMLMGPEVLGRIADKHVKGLISTHTVVDCGRIIEAETLIKTCGYSNVAIVTISRGNNSFEGDSREDIGSVNAKYKYHINNEFDLELYNRQVVKVLKELGLVDDEV